MYIDSFSISCLQAAVPNLFLPYLEQIDLLVGFFPSEHQTELCKFYFWNKADKKLTTINFCNSILYFVHISSNEYLSCIWWWNFQNWTATTQNFRKNLGSSTGSYVRCTIRSFCLVADELSVSVERLKVIQINFITETLCAGD